MCTALIVWVEEMLVYSEIKKKPSQSFSPRVEKYHNISEQIRLITEALEASLLKSQTVCQHLVGDVIRSTFSTGVTVDFLN